MNRLLLKLPENQVWVCAYMPINIQDFEISTIPERRCETSSCAVVLSGFKTRGTRIIHDEYHFVIPFFEWQKLCVNCKKLLHSWYYEKLYHPIPNDRLPFELFDIEIEKEATIDYWQYISHMMHFSCSDEFRTEAHELLDVEVRGMLDDVTKRFRNKAKQLNFTSKGN